MYGDLFRFSKDVLDQRIKFPRENEVNILALLEPESFSQVICNPPFYKLGTGRQNSDDESLLARHQILANLDETVAAAAAVLRSGGYLVMIYPAEELSELLISLSVHRLEAKRLQCVYSYPNVTAAARMIVVSAVKNDSRGIQVLPTFYKNKKPD